MSSRKLVVEIIGDSSSLRRSLAGAAAATDSFGGKLSTAGSRMSAVGKSMTRDLTLPIVGIGAVATKSAMDFQSSMELIHTQAGASQQAVEGMSKAVLAMAGSVATTPETLSTGLFHLASQGLRGKQALDALKIAAEGAKVGQANLEDVTNALGASIVSGIKGAGNFSEAMGMLNATVGAGDMHMQDLADAMGTGLPAKAALAGVSLRDVGAALAVFGDNNIRGAKAGTDLASAIRLMAAPSKAAAKELATVGLSATQLADDMRSKGLVAAIADLKGHMHEAGLSANQMNLLIARAFGGKQATGVSILIDQLDRLKKKTESVGAGAHGFGKAWEATTKTTAFKMAQMGASMQAAGISIGTVLLPVVAIVTNKIGQLAHAFDQLSPAQKQLVLIGAGALAALGPIVSVVGNVSKAIGGLVKTFETVGPAVMKAGGAIATLIEANPVIAGVVAAVAILAIAGYELYRHWDEVRGYLLEVWNAIKASFSSAINAIEGALASAWHAIRDTAVKVWDEIKSHLGLIAIAVATVILGPIGGLVALIATHWREILTAAEDAWNAIRNAISHALDAIKSVIEGALGWIATEAEKIGKYIAHGVVSGLDSMLGFVKGAAESWAKKALGFLKHPWSILSPSRVTHDQIGIPIAQGIIEGYLEGINPLAGKISETVRLTLERAKHTIESYRSQLSSTWSTLVSDANTAFMGIEKAAGTMAGNLLASLTAVKNAADMKDQFAQAQAALSSASSTAAAGTTDSNGNAVQQPQDVAAAFAKLQQAYQAVTAATQQYGAASKQAVDAQKALIAATSAAQLTVNTEKAGPQQSNDQAVVDAQKSLNDLLYTQTQAALQKKAALEKKDAAALAAEKKKRMDEALAALKVHLEQIHATHQQAQDAIIKLLNSYGVNYESSGKALGDAFANGLRASIANAEKAAQELASAVAKYLPHSPAEKGPLSKPIGWGSYLMTGLAGSAAAASAALASGLAAPSAMGAVGGAGDGGRAVHVHVHVDGNGMFIGSQQELADQITSMLVRQGNSGHPYWRVLNRLV